MSPKAATIDDIKRIDDRQQELEKRFNVEQEKRHKMDNDYNVFLFERNEDEVKRALQEQSIKNMDNRMENMERDIKEIKDLMERDKKEARESMDKRFDRMEEIFQRHADQEEKERKEERDRIEKKYATKDDHGLNVKRIDGIETKLTTAEWKLHALDLKMAGYAALAGGVVAVFPYILDKIFK